MKGNGQQIIYELAMINVYIEKEVKVVSMVAVVLNMRCLISVLYILSCVTSGYCGYFGGMITLSLYQVIFAIVLLVQMMYLNIVLSFFPLQVFFCDKEGWHCLGVGMCTKWDLIDCLGIGKVGK